jgi:histone H3/H4
MSLRLRTTNERKQAAPTRRSKGEVEGLCEDILADMSSDVTLDDEALQFVRLTGKAFVDKLMKDAKLIAAHCGRTEVSTDDVNLVLRLRE